MKKHKKEISCFTLGGLSEDFSFYLHCFYGVLLLNMLCCVFCAL